MSHIRTVSGLLLLALLVHHAANAAELDCSTGNWPEMRLRASASGGETMVSVEQGSEFGLRISGGEESHITILVQDPTGKVRVLAPTRPFTGDKLEPGTELLFPDTNARESLIADLNVGTARVCVLATERPISTSLRGGQSAEYAFVEMDQLQTRLSALDTGRVARARLPVMVRAPSVKEFVSQEEFVKFYSVGTRSVKNADRGFRIGFKLNSADLDEFSRKQLEAVGKGMRDASISAFKFLIEGHTDDQGPPDYNMDLSVRRAAAVRTYLSQVTGVPRNRLEVQGLGMSKPQVQGGTEEARSQNRRVVIRRLD